MKTHKQFDISTTPFNSDIISGLLWQLDIEGITENEFSLTLYAGEDSDVSKLELQSLLNSIKAQNLIESFSIEESSIEEKNWNEEWEKTINVIEVNDKIAIKPSFKEYSPKVNQLVITIDPKMSFGTGDHETTKLVLGLMDRYLKKESSVLDVGSGTGVLSIVAALLGAEKVIAVDNDIWCLENGKENVELNNVSTIVSVKLGEIYDVTDEQFDLVLANINKHILLQIVDKVNDSTKKDGTVILSGLLVTDRDNIVSLYKEKGLSLIEEKILGEWLALVFIKNYPSRN